MAGQLYLIIFTCCQYQMSSHDDSLYEAFLHTNKKDEDGDFTFDSDDSIQKEASFREYKNAKRRRNDSSYESDGSKRSREAYGDSDDDEEYILSEDCFETDLYHSW